MERILRMPSTGEGSSTEGGTVTAIPVIVGNPVQAGDCLLEIETDKVAIEVPSECDGVLQEIMVRVGDQLLPGAEFARLSVDGDASGRAAGGIRHASLASEADADGPSTSDDCRGPDSARFSGSEDADGDGARSAGSPNTSSAAPRSVRANPGARRLARQFGIDIREVRGTGSRGRITKTDVRRHADRSGRPVPGPGLAARELPDQSGFGPIHREPLSRVAAVTSDNMTTCWSEIPHAWLEEVIDVTELEAWRQKHKEEVGNQGGALTFTVFLAKVVASGLRAFPRLNSSYDASSKEIVYKDYVDVGIAVDTEYGLVVPVLRGVDEKPLGRLAGELRTLAGKAHERRLSPNDLQGAGITISNLGAIGLRAMLPIVSWPQVAVIGATRARLEPKWRNGEVAPRLELTVSLGFDHRVVNGAEGARFLVFIKERLEDIRLMLL